jgi:hypothetical protein
MHGFTIRNFRIDRRVFAIVQNVVVVINETKTTLQARSSASDD